MPVCLSALLLSHSLAPSWVVILNFGSWDGHPQRVVGAAELLRLHKLGALQVQTLLLAVSSQPQQQLQQLPQQQAQQLQHREQRSLQQVPQGQANGSQQGGKENRAAPDSSSGTGLREDVEVLRSVATLMPIPAAFFRWV